MWHNCGVWFGSNSFGRTASALVSNIFPLHVQSISAAIFSKFPRAVETQSLGNYELIHSCIGHKSCCWPPPASPAYRLSSFRHRLARCTTLLSSSQKQQPWSTSFCGQPLRLRLLFGLWNQLRRDSMTGQEFAVLATLFCTR